jgi:hypothetical protein
MRLARSTVLTVALAALVSALCLIGSPAKAAPAAPAAAGTLSAPVTGSFTDAQGGAGTFSGTFTPHKFVKSGSHVVAQGTLAGTLTDSAGATVGTVSRSTSLALASAAPATTATRGSAVPAATCSILDLVLAPLDLNLLGLTVHLNQVVLNIAAQSGAGALLGNLLCAVTNLLNGSGLAGLGAGLLTALTALLNQIVGLL